MALESQRAIHEDLERLEDAIAARYLDAPKKLRGQRAADHEIASFLDRIQSQSQRLKSIYADADGSLKAEVQRTGTGDTVDAFLQAYDELKEHHAKYPGATSENLEKAYAKRPPNGDGTTMFEKVGQMFSGEEALGRYFDLIELHERYLNLNLRKGTRRISYLQYVEAFDAFEQYPIARPHKLSDAYWKYVNDLADYLEGFWKRTRPLQDWQSAAKEWDQEFDEEWKNDKVKGWGKEEAVVQGDAVANDDDADDVQDTERQGEYHCSACDKHFTNKNVFDAHFTGKRHKNAVKAQQTANGETAKNAGRSTKERVVAAREFRIRRLTASMQYERQDTKANIERRAGMTERERQLEIEQLMAEGEGEGEGNEGGADGEGGSDDEEKFSNPLKLPLSWDGKPIPYWLYKLHGLGVEYECEICGNYIYAGRRAFEKHFSEPRHTYGLKCLGINNSNMFREITKQSEAIKLKDQFDAEKKQEKLRNKGEIEEMEDGQGNVMPKTVYEDLRKQGMI